MHASSIKCSDGVVAVLEDADGGHFAWRCMVTDGGMLTDDVMLLVVVAC